MSAGARTAALRQPSAPLRARSSRLAERKPRLPFCAPARIEQRHGPETGIPGRIADQREESVRLASTRHRRTPRLPRGRRVGRGAGWQQQNRHHCYLDRTSKPGQLLLLGSASRDLIKQSSESLAGRISYIEIGPFVASEVEDFQKLWVQGGYPRSYFLDQEMSRQWRLDYIRTFLERDLRQLGFNIPSQNLSRFWTMLAHSHGSLLNQSTLASSMGLSVPTIKNYLDILEGTFVIRRLPPFHTNTKKRLIKSPKIYIRDSGLVHTLLGIDDFNELLGHPIRGAGFESTVIESLLQNFPGHEACFYRSSGGAEIDLILEKGPQRIAVEIKTSSAPRLSQGFFEALKIVQPQYDFVIAPVKDSFPLKEEIWVHPLKRFLELDLSKSRKYSADT